MIKAPVLFYLRRTGEVLESLYTTMVKIRRFDERTIELFNRGLVKGTAHSDVGAIRGLV